jgi:hypothetical protein
VAFWVICWASFGETKVEEAADPARLLRAQTIALLVGRANRHVAPSAIGSMHIAISIMAVVKGRLTDSGYVFGMEVNRIRRSRLSGASPTKRFIGTTDDERVNERLEVKSDS